MLLLFVMVLDLWHESAQKTKERGVRGREAIKGDRKWPKKGIGNGVTTAKRTTPGAASQRQVNGFVTKSPSNSS